MPTSAPKNVLITDVTTYLGAQIANAYLIKGVNVFGLAKNHLSRELLKYKNFTLIDLDISQPFSSNLPQFDVIFCFTNTSTANPQLPPYLPNLILAPRGSKVVLVAHITSDPDLFDNQMKKAENLQIFLVGDIYGPGMDLTQNSLLTTLIAQAIAGSRVILENEGLDIVYPTFIKDVTGEIENVVGEDHASKQIHFVTSESPKTTLSVAYEIQKAAQLYLNHQIDLFFQGEYQPSYLQSAVKIPHQEHKTELEKGLEETFTNLDKEPQKKKEMSPRFVQAAPPEKTHSYPKKFPKLSGNYRPHLTTKIPSFIPSSRSRLIILSVALILLAFSAKAGLDLYLGTTNLKSAKSATEKGEFAKAAIYAGSARSSFEKAGGKVKIATTLLSPLFHKQITSINYTLESASYLADSAAHAALGADSLTKDIAIITSKDKKEGFDLESPAVNFQVSKRQATKAIELAKLASASSPFKKQTEQLQGSAQNLAGLSTASLEITHLIPYVTGQGQEKTYLLLFQNNMELRPGGGFIGNVGEIFFKDNKLADIKVEDVYNIDGQLKEKLEPPKELKDKLGVNNFYLRDSSWTPDFSQNATIARDLFKKETGKVVDGVIAFDINYIQEILKSTGPIELPDYNETITTDNLFEKGEYYSEIGFFPGSTQKKDFFGALTRALITKVLQHPTLAIIEATNKALWEKHVTMAFDNANLAAYIKNIGANNPLPPTKYNPADDTTQTRDFLAISEANVGANKVNRFIKRKIRYEMTIGRDADLVAKLKITYTNESQADTWPAGKYVNFLRVYMPVGATLLEYASGDKTDIKEIDVKGQFNLSVFSTFVEVPIKSTKEVTFTYRLPKNIKLETTPTYALYVQKQPGTDQDPFEFVFNLPNYLVTKSVNGKAEATQNLDIETDLLTDRLFEVEVKEK